MWGTNYPTCGVVASGGIPAPAARVAREISSGASARICPRRTPLAGVEYPAVLTWPNATGLPVLHRQYPTSGVAAG
jgi:hypothetical protein